jgi:hypothetical protein
MVSAMLKPKDQAKFTKCIPMLSNLVCHTILPRCDKKCEPMKACKDSCTDVFNGCIPKDAVKDIDKVRKGGSYRPIILSTLMASEGAPVINVVDQILDLLTTPDCTQSFYEDSAKTNKACLSSQHTGGTCKAPKPIVINQIIAKKTHDNMDILRKVVDDADVQSNTVKAEKEVNTTMRVDELKKVTKLTNGKANETVDEDYIEPLPGNVCQTQSYLLQLINTHSGIDLFFRFHRITLNIRVINNFAQDIHIVMCFLCNYLVNYNRFWRFASTPCMLTG